MNRRRFYMSGFIPDQADPYERLLFRYILQAVFDALWPTKTVKLNEYRSAVIFVCSHDGRAMINALGIPYHKLDTLAFLSLPLTHGGGLGRGLSQEVRA